MSEEQMTIEVLGKTYEVIEVIPKKHSEYDLFLCKSKAGYKECFQRIDIGREPKKVKMSDAVAWTLDEIELIKNELRRGKLPCEIAMNEKLNRHTQNATYVRARDIKNNMIYKKELKDDRKRGPRFKVRF